MAAAPLWRHRQKFKGCAEFGRLCIRCSVGSYDVRCVACEAPDSNSEKRCALVFGGLAVRAAQGLLELARREGHCQYAGHHRRYPLALAHGGRGG
jgi:hypothetical protein